MSGQQQHYHTWYQQSTTDYCCSGCGVAIFADDFKRYPGILPQNLNDAANQVWEHFYQPESSVTKIAASCVHSRVEEKTLLTSHYKVCLDCKKEII